MAVGGEGPGFTCCPFHAQTCTYLPEQVRGRIGDALVGGCDGGDVGNNRSQFFLVGPRSAIFGFVCPAWLLWLAFLMFLLCAHDVPSARVWEHSGLSPRPHVLWPWLFPSMVPLLLRSLQVRLFRARVLWEGVESRCVRCVVHLMLLWLQVLRCDVSVARYSHRCTCWYRLDSGWGCWDQGWWSSGYCAGGEALSRQKHVDRWLPCASARA